MQLDIQEIDSEIDIYVDSSDKSNLKKPNNNLISHFDLSYADLKDVLNNAINDKI